MSRFRLREIRARNYRCFDELTLPIEEDTTVLFAENGGGKTAVDGRIQEGQVFVEGRDTNAILREHMNTDDRDEEGVVALRRLHDAIDRGDREETERIYRDLLRRWGDTDPALIRAQDLMEE